jgi:hypothetical protein
MELWYNRENILMKMMSVLPLRRDVRSAGAGAVGSIKERTLVLLHRWKNAPLQHRAQILPQRKSATRLNSKLRCARTGLSLMACIADTETNASSLTDSMS